MAAAEQAEQNDTISAHDDEVRHARASIAAHFAAARRAVRLARAYASEPGTSGRRERECMQSVATHRSDVRRLRIALRPQEQLALPGLAKTKPADAVRTTKTA